MMQEISILTDFLRIAISPAWIRTFPFFCFHCPVSVINSPARFSGRLKKFLPPLLRKPKRVVANLVFPLNARRFLRMLAGVLYEAARFAQYSSAILVLLS
jgi:hypothetical protein